jgi:hypothetical protein
MPADAPEQLAGVDVDDTSAFGMIDVREPGGHIGVPHDGD